MFSSSYVVESDREEATEKEMSESELDKAHLAIRLPSLSNAFLKTSVFARII